MVGFKCRGRAHVPNVQILWRLSKESILHHLANIAKGGKKLAFRSDPLVAIVAEGDALRWDTNDYFLSKGLIPQQRDELQASHHHEKS